MHSFGKLTARPTVFELKDAEENVTYSQPVWAFYDVNNVLWHDLFPLHEHAFYIAVLDDGSVISIERDPQHSQVSDAEIVGIDQENIAAGLELVPGSEGGTIVGFVWDGSIIGPRPVSRATLFPPLAKWRFEAMIDIYGQQNGVNLRGQIDAAIEAMPEPSRTIAKSKRQNVQEYSRDDPLFDLIGSAVPSMTSQTIDTLWTAAHNL